MSLPEGSQLFFEAVHSTDHGETDEKREKNVLRMPVKGDAEKGQIKRNLREQGKEPHAQQIALLAVGMLHAFDQHKDIDRESDAPDVTKDVIDMKKRTLFCAMQQKFYRRCTEMIDQHGDQRDPFQNGRRKGIGRI